jgi:hypothetical protein
MGAPIAIAAMLMISPAVHLSPSAFADVATTVFITLISALAQFPGFQLALFPELGGLSQ